MKLRELGSWVGLQGTTLRRRAKSLGYEYNLEDQLDMIVAGKLYRELPVEKIMTLSYKNPNQPSIEFVGSWNINDWHRLFKKVQHLIMVRNRDFMRAARKNGQQAVIEDQPATNVDADNNTAKEAENAVSQEQDNAREQTAGAGTPEPVSEPARPASNLAGLGAVGLEYREPDGAECPDADAGSDEGSV